MIGIVRYIFGYAVITVDEEDISRAITRLLNLKISCEVISGGEIIIPLFALKRVREKLKDIEIRSISECGAPIHLRALSKRRGIILAIAVFLMLQLLSSFVLWDIRLEGEFSEEENGSILEELSSSGLSVGKFWLSLDRDKIEAEVLAKSERISWLNINRRGTVAYVSIVKKEIHEEEKKPQGFSNVVASRDGVIEDILVKEGIALVSRGESVRGGQMLISGVIPADKGGGYLYAEGEVIARFSEEVRARATATLTEKVYKSEKKRDFMINFFGLNINIFKKYGNSPELCDIIEKKQDVYILGVKLPISYTIREICEYELKEKRLTLSEMTSIAREEMEKKLRERLDCGELISIKTSASYEDDYYELIASIVMLEDIAENKEFEFNLE